MRNALVIAAHPDDEVLGAGAAVRRFISEGAAANAIILGEGLTSRKGKPADTAQSEIEDLHHCTRNAAKMIGYTQVEFFNFPDNRFDSVDLLEIIKVVAACVEKYRPDTIFTQHYGDLNIDHARTFQAVLTACRPVQDCCVQEIYCFETPSSTEWNFQYGGASFKPNFFVDVSDTIEQKLEAMSCYTTETAPFPHPRSSEALRAIARRWGSVAGCAYAEAFELIRSVVKRSGQHRMIGQ